MDSFFRTVGDYMTASPYLALLLLVLIIVVIGNGAHSVLTVGNNLIRLIMRFFRMFMVLARGWPPAHLDADGDWRPKPAEPAPPGDLVSERIERVGDVSMTTRVYKAKAS